MSDRIAELESLAKLKASGDITAEEFSSRKAQIMGVAEIAEEPVTLSDEDVQAFWGTGIGLVGIVLGAALFYFNGWAIGPGSPPYGIGTDLGFYVGPYSGAYAIFLKVSDGWYGIARTNLDALLIDSPMLNAIALVAAWVFLWEGAKSFIWPGHAQAEEEKQ